METINRILQDRITARISPGKVVLIFGAQWYFYDNGIRNAIIGAFSPLAIRQDVGALWENYIIGERRKVNFNKGQHKEFFFWRTYDKQEIDLVEVSSEHLTALEFKWGNKMPVVPKAFQEAYPHAEFHVVNRDNYLEFIEK